MAAYKSLIHRVVVEVAKGSRTCHHNRKHAIRKDEISVIVLEGQFRQRVYKVAHPPRVEVPRPARPSHPGRGKIWILP